MWLSVEMQWHGPGRLCIRIHSPTCDLSHAKILPFSPFDIVFASGNWFLPEGALSPRLGKVKWSAVTVLHVEKGRQRWDIRVCLERREKVTSFHIHQTPNLSTRERLGVHAKIPSRKRAHNRPSSLKKKLWIISRTVDVIKCCCLVFMRYLHRAASMAEAYHPLVQMLWEVFKGFASFREEGAVQPLWSVPLSAVKMFGPCDATAALHRRSLHPLSSLQPPPKALSRNNGHKGLRVL